MQGIKLTCFNGVWLRGDTSFDLSKVLDVQPARLQGEDVTCTLHWGPDDVEVTQEEVQKMLETMPNTGTANSGPQAYYLESE
jgi:hypothetical protein